MNKSPLEQLPNTYRPFFGKFSSLTTAQKALIQPILNGRDVVLQAGTGSGKTEAVLAPATERLMTYAEHFTIVYIVPTRALALDMNRRIQPLYKQLGLKSGIRTGDGKTQRDAMPHLLILTPESLDVLLGSQNADNQYFLKHVRVMIIDEVHIFLHDERGYQLSYLRRRLEMQSRGGLQTIALSATISGFEDIATFFKLKDVFYYKDGAARKLQPCWVHLENEELELVPFFNDLSLRWGCQKLLVFANSRRKCEQLFELLNHEGTFSQHVLLHYSNLSTKERRYIESAFRNNKKSVCIATSTLEMGIDIGDVDGVVLMGPPPSSMAFLQRIGRGNRRQQHVSFWGICQGAHAKQHLLRFLALFELAKETQVEKLTVTDNYSVLFQQMLSCLYAKKIVSQKSLDVLFSEHKEACRSIFQEMVDKNWLKAMPQPGLFYGGWRYMMAFKQQKIWSNFPPTEEEYDVILEQETIAVLPFSAVKELERGDLIQLAGKVLKILQIEEKKTTREVWVEESSHSASKDLLWIGFGVPTSYEVAQKMGVILLEKRELPQGLLNRTRQLLEKARDPIEKSVSTPCGIWIHRLENDVYRYETFLGSVGNFILYHLIKEQFTPKIEGLSVSFDELGVECNAWISFEFLELPYSVPKFQKWISSHLSLLRQAFPWNSWLHWLPKDLQQKEISSFLLDLRILAQFERYHKDWMPISPPQHLSNPVHMQKTHIPLKGEPWSLEQEKQAWGWLSFAEIPNTSQEHRSLTATQIQGYVTQKLCPRWARFQHLDYSAQSHSRFHVRDQDMQSRREQGIAFKKQVIEKLQQKMSLRWETATFNWKEAIKEVIASQKPLFLARTKLEVDKHKGIPDLIYIKHEESHICLEIWDVKNGQAFTYAQKWRIAFYAYLLESLLKKEAFLLPVKVSDLGGLVYRHVDKEKLFERTPFLLTHYRSWMPRLITQWETNALQSSAIQDYSMDSSCTSCRYFSYCYQESLFKESAPPDNPSIVCLEVESNDFPKNSKEWFFLYYDQKSVRWQCWNNNKECLSETCIHSEEYTNWSTFQEAVSRLLQKEWHRSIAQGNNPHFLVYEVPDWLFFQKAFQSTPLQSLWAMHVCWTSMQSVLQKHFLWPIWGRLTATQVALCLGLHSTPIQPLSLYHRESAEISFAIYKQIWSWCLSQVKSRRVVSFDLHKARSVPLINAYLAAQHREAECRMHAILEFQKNPLSTRTENFRAIGPLVFLGAVGGKQKCYQFSIDAASGIAKFRVGDFLKLSPVESSRIQEGFSVVLESYSPEERTLSVRPMSQKITLSKTQLYALDENATDWNAPKISKVLTLLKDPRFRPELIQMLFGRGKSFPASNLRWAEQWYQTHAQAAGLNRFQVDALMLPFKENIGLIEGPPGTGKTHLLIWTLIALAAHAKSLHRPLKILVTAQTHQAIDQILSKVANALRSTNVAKICLWKYGRYDRAQFAQLGIHALRESKPLYEDENSSLILGATGFGIYELLEGKNFPQLFDWVIFDESSQVLPSYALLSLIFGKGNALFYGDTQQLPPVLMGNYDHASFTPRSILQELIARCDSHNRLRLNETYRMNKDICNFPSRHWYKGELHPAPSNKDQKLELPRYPLFGDLLDVLLDPSKSMAVVQLDHEGCRQSSQEEALWIAKAVKRLIEDYSISSDEIGIISPHRLQNNTISCALKESLPLAVKRPKIDTVERMQGLEFDIVIFSATVSDKEVIHSGFLRDYRRFNVALTRSRKKFLFVGSALFFQAFPLTEKELVASLPFDDFFTLHSN